ncbi:MAG TPA: pantetheine-phosphate adenylyltransferase [Cytophagales bacterium]|jgi:pantetheine-phosphate adenylyltransferase|nr:pantetheine-phosphate adenylyltransferase [Cytophagales bacterium]
MTEPKVALFPGSFDPFTKGHEDIVKRGLQLFDKVVICIGHNSQKKRYFDIDLMIEKIKEAFDNSGAIEVVTYNDLTATLARNYNAKYLLRGLRNTTDFEYENSIAQVNKRLNVDLETVFLITSPEYAFISSSIIREVHRYEGDVTPYLPYRL